jgi:hypothetical protein
VDQDRRSSRADLWRRAPQAGAAAPSDEIAHGSRKTRDRQPRGGARGQEEALRGHEGGKRASIAIAPDPLYVDSSQHARRLSGPTFAEAAVEPGLVL